MSNIEHLTICPQSLERGEISSSYTQDAPNQKHNFCPFGPGRDAITYDRKMVLTQNVLICKFL